MMVILTGVRWCLILVLNCLSVIIEMLGCFFDQVAQNKAPWPHGDRSSRILVQQKWIWCFCQSAAGFLTSPGLYEWQPSVHVSLAVCVCVGGVVSVEAGQEDRIVSKCSLSDKCSLQLSREQNGKEPFLPYTVPLRTGLTPFQSLILFYFLKNWNRIDSFQNFGWVLWIKIGPYFC